MSGCGCQTEECSCHDGLHGYFLGDFGALTPDEAVEQVIPRSATGWAGQMRAATVLDVQTGQLVRGDTGGPIYVPGTPDCAAAGPQTGVSNLQLAQTASGLALTGATIGLTAAGTVAAATLAPITLGLSALIGLFPLLFGHHGKAVAREQSVLCAAVPAANNYLRIIDQAVHSGQVDPQHGIDALNSLLSDFRSQVGSIMQGNSPAEGKSCNAACVSYNALHAIVIYKSSEYQDLIDGAAQSVAPARPNVTSPAGSTMPASSYASFYGQPTAPAPSSSQDWLPIAALALAGFFFLRSV